MRNSTVRRLSKLHTIAFRVTRGRIGRRLVSNTMLLLTTTGARTGQPHTTPLLYLQDGDRIVVIASFGGRPHHPQWYLNLVANPVATVELPGGRRHTVTARTADPSEREAWWPRIVDSYKGYAEYQSRTDREIPVVFLES